MINKRSGYDNVLCEYMDVRESVIEKFFTQHALTYDCMQHKIIGVLSWPDRALLWPCGITDYIELKRPKGGRYEKGQLRTHANLRKAGFTVEVLNTKFAVRLYFKQRAATLGVRRLTPLTKQLKNGSLCATDLRKALV